MSICLTADIVNVFLSSKIIKISSVRGNLFSNYSEYPLGGTLLALFHLNLQRFFKYTIVMNKKMYLQVKKYSSKNPTLIYNFIDEEYLDKFFKSNISKSKIIQFVFLGRLIKRKGIISLLYAFKQVLKKQRSHLHILGEGPLREELEAFIVANNMNSNVTIHGFIDSPYEILSNSDVFVLPSYSEGTPRACLEALYLGIPSILRNVDANKELKERKNISLFDHDYELANLMLKKGIESRSRLFRKNLLPKRYSKKYILDLYLKVFKL